jgi:hypothetical protein
VIPIDKKSLLMKNFLQLILAMVVLFSILPSITGCIRSSPENRYYIPLESSSSQEGEEVADDVVPQPGGIAYRANVHQAGDENPWPSIESTTVRLNSGKPEITLRYRNEIVTQAGETRNNIFTILKIDDWVEPNEVTNIKYYTSHKPKGFILTYYLYAGLAGSLRPILSIEVLEETQPGRYKLDIGLEIKSKDYGTVPCVIEVVEDTIEKSMVKVFQNGDTESPVAFGIAVGDGNHILTVLNYEEYTPESDNLYVVSAKGDRFNASVETIDPRTSATLLVVEGADLPPVRIADSEDLWNGRSIYIQGWHADTTFTKASATIGNIAKWPPFFGIWLSDTALKSGEAVTRNGAAITDKVGNVVGLAGTIYYSLIAYLGAPGLISPCIPIDSALELLAPNATSQIWAKGPAVMAIVTDTDIVTASNLMRADPFAYDCMTQSVQSLFGTLGRSLEDDTELAQGFRDYFLAGSFSWDQRDGKLMMLCYPGLQELRNTDGELLALAKWVGIQWDRSEGKPDRIVYGTVPYKGEGIYELTGDMTHLEECLK